MHFRRNESSSLQTRDRCRGTGGGVLALICIEPIMENTYKLNFQFFKKIICTFGHSIFVKFLEEKNIYVTSVNKIKMSHE
jgi:hypothetical protein